MRVEQLLRDSACRYGDVTAIIAGRYRHSYADLELKSGRLAAAIAARGVAPGERIALYMDAGPAAVVALFAILKAGAVACPIDSRMSADALAARLIGCRAVGVITEARLAQATGEAIREAPDVRLVVLSGADRATAGGNCISLEAAVAGIGPAAIAAVGTAADPAVELSVVGVDGQPTGETFSHADLIAAAAAAKTRQDSIVSTPLSIASHGGLYQLVNAVVGGVTLVMEQTTTRLGAQPRGPAAPAYQLAV